MADEAWGVGFAVGVQTALGTQNATIAALTGALGVSDGIVLGDRESGDAESGITFPDLVREVREVADVAGSFTKQFDTLLRTSPQNMSISVQLKGNGATATPLAGEAQPDAGLDALWQAAGFVGANGTAPDFDYTPRIGSTSPSTRYVTMKLWEGDLSFVLWDAICSSTEVSFTPGGIAIVTFNFEVGSFDPASDFADGVTLPTFAYGNQASLAAPVVQGVGSSWGTTKGWEDLTITVDQEIEEIGDANQANGIRKVQNARSFLLNGTLFVDTADSDFEFQNLVSSVAPTADMTFTVGTPAGATDTINAITINANNLLSGQVKYDKRGNALAVEFDNVKCTGTTAGSEFLLRFE